jgi:hypothetical protein
MQMKLLTFFKSHKTGANHHDDLYGKLRKLHRTYANSNSQVKTFFIHADPEINDDIIIDSDDFLIKENENHWEALLIKFFYAIRFFVKEDDYSHLFWTNLSTVPNFEKLLKECDNTNIKSSIGSYGGYNFPSGAGMLFSKNFAIKLLSFINSIDPTTLNSIPSDYPTTDDIFLGKALDDMGESISPLDRLDLLSPFEKLNKPFKNFSHIRIKFPKSHRDSEFLTHKNIVEELYF